jgi:ferredoxin
LGAIEKDGGKMKKTTKKAAAEKTAKKETARKKTVPKKAAEKPVLRTRAAASSASLPKQACVPNIDYSLCQGCGGCAEAFPQLFEMRGERAWVINPETFDPVRDAGVMTICPYYAVSIVKV